MGKRAITPAALGLSIALAAFAPIRAEDPKPAEPPKADSAEPERDRETPGKSDQEMLNELLARREKARSELLLMEAQLAVKRAEVQRADAEVQVFRVQHPDTLDETAFRAWVMKDPEIGELRAQLERAVKQVEGIARLVRSDKDPSLRHATSLLNARREKLENLIKLKKDTYIATEVLNLPSRESRSPGEVERKLDRIIGELENLRRALTRDTREP